MSKNILAKENTRLTIFEDNIVIDKKLPKWRNAERGLEKTKTPNGNEYSGVMTNTVSNLYLTTSDDTSTNIISLNQHISERNVDVDEDVNASMSWLPYYEIADGVNFDTIASAGIKELTKYIAENKLKFVIGGYGSLGRTQGATLTLNGNFYDVPTNNNIANETVKKDDIWHKFKNIFKFKKATSDKDSADLIDALQFFKLVKLTSKDSASTYRDRVSDYLKAVYNAASVGQTALLEDLIRGMVTNKYESVLYSEGYYNVISEEQMVKFVKSCEKGIKLDYIKNFTRPLPFEVVEKVNKLNNLEIFDNYVILYYDPDGFIYKETAAEEAKRKDPILFGVIAGSNKLYYIADWVDEYCDLSLEKFIDTIGVSMEQIHLDYKPNDNAEKHNETKKVTKKSKKKYYRKTNKNNKK